MEELDYEAGKALIVFEKYTLYEDIKEIADRMGAFVDVLDGSNKTLLDYMETGAYGEQYFYAAFDFGISMSAPMALEILQKIDCIKAADLNAYIPADTGSDETKKPDPEQDGSKTTVDLEEKQETGNSQTEQNLNQDQKKQTSTEARKEKKNIQKGVVYTVSGLNYKVLDVKRKEAGL